MGEINCMPGSINDDIYSGRLSLADNKAQYKSIMANGCSKRIIKTSRNLFDENEEEVKTKTDEFSRGPSLQLNSIARSGTYNTNRGVCEDGSIKVLVPPSSRVISNQHSQQRSLVSVYAGGESHSTSNKQVSFPVS